MTTAFLDSLVSSLEDNNLIQETKGSYIRATCPICGDHSLKINITLNSEWYGAYKCWTNSCPQSEIRKALGIEKTVSAPINAYTKSNIYSKSNVYSAPSHYKPVTNSYENNFDGSVFLRTKDTILPSSTNILFGKKLIKKTVYQYSPYLRVSRLDELATGKKKVFIQHWNQDQSWVPGTGDKIWPVYGIHSVLDSASNFNLADSVIFVEGEKSACFLQAQGYAAFTFAAHCFYASQRDNAIILFKYFFPNIKNIIYVEDADRAGKTKETYVREGFNLAKLNYRNIDLVNLLGEDKKDTGFDVADMSSTEYDIFNKYLLEVCQKSKT